MMKTALGIAVALLFLTILGCSNSNTPEGTLTRFLTAKFNNNPDAAYLEVSDSDKMAKSLLEFTEELDNPFAAAMVDKITFEIASVSITGNEAIADVAVTAPDLTGMFGELLGAAFKSAFEEDGGATMDSTLEKTAETVADGDLDTTTNHEEFRLILEDGTWRVFLGWQVDGLLAEAGAYRENNELDNSLKAYNEALKLDSKSVEARQGFEEVQSEISELHEQKKYLDKIELYDFVAKYYESYFDGKVPGVRFKVKNNGDRTLNKVKVSVYFQDANDNTIAEEDFHPVLISKYSFGDDKPLKAGYIWEMDKGKFYKVENLPSEWAEGKATAKVTEIEFAE